MIKFLTACAQVEEKAAQIYQAMRAAALEKKDADLVELWQGMATDEEAHAQQLHLAARLSRERVFEVAGIEDDAHPAVLIKRAEAILGYVRSGHLTELEMLRIADELENRFCKLHATYLLLFQDPSMKSLFDALAKADEQHVAALQERLREAAGRRRAAKAG